MTNPYHDDKGRFTSREGMVAAIKELALKKDVTGYLALNADLQQIDAHNAELSKKKEQTLEKSTSVRSMITKNINEQVINGELHHYYSPQVSIGAKTVTVLLDSITDEERNRNEVTISKDISAVRESVKNYLTASGKDKNVRVRVLTNSERKETVDKLNRKARKEAFVIAPRYHSDNHRRVRVHSLQAGMVISDTEKVHKVYRDSTTPSGKYSVEIINVLGEVKTKHWNSSTEISVGDLTAVK